MNLLFEILSSNPKFSKKELFISLIESNSSIFSFDNFSFFTFIKSKITLFIFFIYDIISLLKLLNSFSKLFWNDSIKIFKLFITFKNVLSISLFFPFKISFTFSILFLKNSPILNCIIVNICSKLLFSKIWYNLFIN